VRVRVRERLCEDGAVRGRLRVAIEGAYDIFYTYLDCISWHFLCNLRGFMKD